VGDFFVLSLLQLTEATPPKVSASPTNNTPFRLSLALIFDPPNR
jgi:hypothetical protein